jgi:hypothetical protein
VSDLLGFIGAMLVFVVPLLLAWWLLGRDERRARRRLRQGVRGKMTDRDH